MASRKYKRKGKEEAETSDEGGTNLPAHTVPETHLTAKAGEEGPGADTESAGTAHATSIAGGALGQRVGLPAPLPPKEAKKAGFLLEGETAPADEEEETDEEREAREEREREAAAGNE